jgi:hypothetical protein
MDIIGGGGGAATDRPRKRKTAAEEVDEVEEEEVDEEEEEEEEEGVIPVAVVAGSKHGDGSIFKPDEHPLHELYHLHDTRESKCRMSSLPFLDRLIDVFMLIFTPNSLLK